MSQKKIVIGNWKMNPESFEDAKNIAKKARAAASRLDHTEVVACPPFPFIVSCVSKNKADPLHVGAQSVSEFEGGAHTGEVGIRHLQNLGVEYVIAGHSEERESGDTNEKVSKRVSKIVEAGMTAVVCVGEKSRDEAGSHLGFLKTQIKETFAGVPQEKAKKIIIAYEPVWAIGAKEAMKPEDIYEMSLFVKKVFADVFGPEAGLKARVLYGGSVNALNAAEIMSVGKVDGLLVGRASVNPPEFAELLKAVDSVN